MAIPESWSIKKRAHECAITKRKFIEGEEFYTAIFPDPETGGYHRVDYSKEAWAQLDEQAPTPFSFWKSSYEPPSKDDKPEVMPKDSAELLLAKLIEQDEPDTENVRYILAIMLERQKILTETDTQKTPNGTLRIYQQKKSGEIYIILDPDIPLDQIIPIQQQVAEMLDANNP